MKWKYKNINKQDQDINNKIRKYTYHIIRLEREASKFNQQRNHTSLTKSPSIIDVIP